MENYRAYHRFSLASLLLKGLGAASHPAGFAETTRRCLRLLMLLLV